MKRLWTLVLLIALGWGVAVAQPARMSIAEADRILTQARDLIMQSVRESDCNRVTRLLREAWGLLQRLPSDKQNTDIVTDLRWRTANRLGLFREARNIFEKGTDSQQEKMLADWRGMQSRYGSVSLDSPEELMGDPTLDVTGVTVLPRAGTSTECPYDQVRARAAREIAEAYVARDLVTEPIILPIGRHRLDFQLSRESALNYEISDTRLHSVFVDFEVRPDSSGQVEPIRIDLKPRKAGLPVLAGLLALLVTPFALAQ